MSSWRRYNPLNYVADKLRARVGDRGMQGIRIVYRTGRVVVIGFSLYNLGYMVGLADYAMDPKAQERKWIQQIVRENGGKHLISERTVEYQRVHHISKQVVHSAQDFALMKCRELAVLDTRFKKLYGDKYKSIHAGEGSKYDEGSKYNEGHNLLSNMYTSTYVPHMPTSMISNASALVEKPSPSSSSSSASTVSSDTVAVTNFLSKDMQSLCNKVGALPRKFGSEAKFSVPHNHLSTIDVQRNSKTMQKVYQMDKLIQSHQHDEGLHTNISDVNMRLWEEYRFWFSAYHRLKGDWTVVLTDCPHPNAMVTPLLNRKIVVNLPLVNLMNDDELAFVIGHECSHYILEHGKAQMEESLFWEMCALIGASLFALEELLLLEYFTNNYFRKASEAAHSQDCENEADHLGVIITGKACYDVAKGISFFDRMGQWENEAAAAAPVGYKKAGSWSSTHPPNEIRLEKCKAYIKSIQKKYPWFYNQDCALVKQTFFGTW